MSGNGSPRGPLLGWDEGRRAADEVRRLRRGAGLTQKDLAAIVGRPQAWVSRRERCAVRMTPGEAGLVAVVLGTDLAGLLGGAT
jgi:transcriptional regulator with XRE-family HTH domain